MSELLSPLAPFMATTTASTTESTGIKVSDADSVMSGSASLEDTIGSAITDALPRIRQIYILGIEVGCMFVYHLGPHGPWFSIINNASTETSSYGFIIMKINAGRLMMVTPRVSISLIYHKKA